MSPLLTRGVRAIPLVGWSVLTLGGLLVGAVALTSEPAGDAAEAPASRLVVELPDLLMTAAGVATSLAILLWFAFLLALARRHRKDGEASRAMWGMLLFTSLVVAGALWHRASPDGLLFHPPRELAAPDANDAAPSDAALPSIASPLFTAVVAALLLAGTLASLGLAALVLFGDRLTEWWTRASPSARHPLATAVDESLDDLLGETDPRQAIIRCYRRFEQVLARSRVPRAPWKTPLEFMREVLGRLPLPQEAVERLTRLFERARFSNESLAPADRDAAWGALVEIRTSLDAKEHDARAF